MNLILNVLKNVVLTFSVKKCQIEALIKFDYKIGDARENLMQLCFSSFAAWPLFLGLGIIAWDPFYKEFSLSNYIAADNFILLSLLDGRGFSMFCYFVLFFVIEWLFRKTTFTILVVCYFLNRFDLHINIAMAAIFAILLSQIGYLWWAVVDIKSESKTIWRRAHYAQLFNWIICFFVGFNALDAVQINRQLSENSWFNRLFFVSVVLLSYYALRFVLLSLWGHFHSKREEDPSYLGTYYSSAHWLLRFSISSQLQKVLREKTEKQLKTHQENLKNFIELKMQNPGLGTLPLEAVLYSEVDSLKEALVRLNKA